MAYLKGLQQNLAKKLMSLEEIEQLRHPSDKIFKEPSTGTETKRRRKPSLKVDEMKELCSAMKPSSTRKPSSVKKPSSSNETSPSSSATKDVPSSPSVKEPQEPGPIPRNLTLSKGKSLKMRQQLNGETMAKLAGKGYKRILDLSSEEDSDDEVVF